MVRTVEASPTRLDPQEATPALKGPWSASTRDYDATWDIRDANDDHVASVPNPYEHLGDRDDLVADAAADTEAKARLIAAAPDLLATLRRSAEGWANAIELGLLPMQHVRSAEILRDEADAAIRKATAQ